mgnify:CR=1 FL=1
MNLSKRIGAGLVAMALVGSALTGATPALAANKTDLVIGSLLDVKSWDPSQADIGHMAPLYQAVYDNLILRTPDDRRALADQCESHLGGWPTRTPADEAAGRAAARTGRRRWRMATDATMQPARRVREPPPPRRRCPRR